MFLVNALSLSLSQTHTEAIPHTSTSSHWIIITIVYTDTNICHCPKRDQVPNLFNVCDTLLVLVILCGAGAKEILQSLSEKQGKKMNTVESAKDIPAFLELFKARFFF